MYLSLHCHDQNDSCIKMGSDESHFNVSLIVRDKVTRQCSQTTGTPTPSLSLTGPNVANKQPTEGSPERNNLLVSL